MNGFSLDVAHMLAGTMVLVSFMLLYQDRMFALLNVFALHAIVLSASVAWQAWLPSHCASGGPTHRSFVSSGWRIVPSAAASS